MATRAIMNMENAPRDAAELSKAGMFNLRVLAAATKLVTDEPTRLAFAALSPEAKATAVVDALKAMDDGKLDGPPAAQVAPPPVEVPVTAPVAASVAVVAPPPPAPAPVTRQPRQPRAAGVAAQAAAPVAVPAQVATPVEAPAASPQMSDVIDRIDALGAALNMVQAETLKQLAGLDVAMTAQSNVSAAAVTSSLKSEISKLQGSLNGVSASLNQLVEYTKQVSKSLEAQSQLQMLTLTMMVTVAEQFLGAPKTAVMADAFQEMAQVQKAAMDMGKGA